MVSTRSKNSKNRHAVAAVEPRINRIQPNLATLWRFLRHSVAVLGPARPAFQCDVTARESGQTNIFELFDELEIGAHGLRPFATLVDLVCSDRAKIGRQLQVLEPFRCNAHDAATG